MRTSPVVLEPELRLILLDRPEKLNALDRSLLERLTRQLHQAEADPAVRGVIYRVFTRDGVLDLYFDGRPLRYESPAILEAPYFRSPDEAPRLTVAGLGARPLRRSKTNRGSPTASRPKRVGGVSFWRKNFSTSLSKFTCLS